MFPHGNIFTADLFSQLKDYHYGHPGLSSKPLHNCQSFQIHVNWFIFQLLLLEHFGIYFKWLLVSPKVPRRWKACIFTFLFFLLGSEHCFRNFTAPTGVIESPDFPDKYPHNLECFYIIIAPPQTEVTLTFKTFDLENDPLLMTEAECKYDWLEVWDGLPQGELLNE